MLHPGLTVFAGAIAGATILSCSGASAVTERTLYTFCSSSGCSDGDIPIGGLVNVGGTLYGTTSRGGRGRDGGYGVVYNLQPKTGTETVEHAFRKKGGEAPYAGLLNIDGVLYGTTAGGGMGTVFSLDPVSAKLTTLHAFTGSDGEEPRAGLSYLKGALYGTTDFGGTYGNGTVFAINPGTGAETVLHSFQDDGSDGYNPYAGLTVVGHMLYGTTLWGGTYDDGTVFAINPKSGAEVVLHSFTGNDGDEPEAGLIAVKGMLYGTTANGGAYNHGTVFALDPGTGMETVVYSFCKDGNCADGETPAAGLISVKGILYGTTSVGGTGQQSGGTIFSLDPATGIENVLYSFCSRSYCADGWHPSSNLIYDNGTLFGTAAYTAQYCGTPQGPCGGVVFSVKP